MEVRFLLTKNVSEKENKEITEINSICFVDVPDEDCELDFVDVSLGKFIMYDNDKAIGSCGIHKRKSEYNGEEYILGGFGELAILPQYRGNGFGKVLAEKAIEKLYEISCDVACFCVDRKHNAYKLYQLLGYTFLQRDAYFIDALGKEKTNDSVMIIGINNKELADKISNTNYKFHMVKIKVIGKRHTYKLNMVAVTWFFYLFYAKFLKSELLPEI